MKTFSFFILFSLCLSIVSAQMNSKEGEVLAIVNAQDSLPRSIFLDEETMGSMKSMKVNTRQVWKSTIKTGKRIEQLYDIRLKFADHNAALDFHHQYLPENAEYGLEIKNHKMKIVGADEFMVFEAPEMIADMVKPYDLKMYCFIFVVKNYFAKIYIMCSTSYKPKEFESYVNKAVQLISQ